MKKRMLVTSLSVVILLSSVFTNQYFTEDYSNIKNARSSSNGLYANTAVGTTRYQVFGDEGDETIIMIPASNGFIEQWKSNVEALVNAGYKVVTYNPIGRGLSDRPRIDLNLSVFRAQLDEIVATHADSKTYLIGSSFGGVIASDYVIHNTDRIEKLMLIGPAGWLSNINFSSKIIHQIGSTTVTGLKKNSDRVRKSSA